MTKYFVALSGNKNPHDYIALGKEIEDLGFDRIYVYDDLLSYPAWSILSLIANHTINIELGSCIVSGLHMHPIKISSNAIFIDKLSNNRFVLGIGKGAFFDVIDFDYSEEYKEQACVEAIKYIKKVLANDCSKIDGMYFKKAENICLQSTGNTIPIIIGSCSIEMAFHAGCLCEEFQTGEIWELSYLNKLYRGLNEGSKSEGRSIPSFSIGGITCISENSEKAYDAVRPYLMQYLPYLKSITDDFLQDELEKIRYFSSKGNMEKASSYITNEIIDKYALVGTPDYVVKKLKTIFNKMNIYGVSIGPPYGTYPSITENLAFIRKNVIANLTEKN